MFISSSATVKFVVDEENSVLAVQSLDPATDSQLIWLSRFGTAELKPGSSFEINCLCHVLGSVPPKLLERLPTGAAVDDGLMWCCALKPIRMERWRGGTDGEIVDFSAAFIDHTRRMVTMLFLTADETFEEHSLPIRQFTRDCQDRIMEHPLPLSPYRVWSDDSREYQIIARYDPQRSSGRDAVLVDATGRTIEVAHSELSAEDRSWIRRYNEYLREEPSNDADRTRARQYRAALAAQRRADSMRQRQAAAENIAETIRILRERALPPGMR